MTAGTAAPVSDVGATTCSVAIFELNGAHRSAGLKPALEFTDSKPSFATATSGPSSIPQGCRRLADRAAVWPPGIAVEPGSLPLTAIPAGVQWRKPLPRSPGVVPLSAPPIAASNWAKSV